MFTGIIEELGRVKKISSSAQHKLLEIEAKNILEGLQIGDSVAVEGVCLTVKEKNPASVVFAAMPYTLKSTTLGFLKINQVVNLERSLKLQERLDGHFVLGHVDCIGIIRKRLYRQENLCFEIAIPAQFKKYCLPKGSIAIDGISLTLAEIKPFGFAVYVIPYTLEHTSLFFKNPSYKVNVEFDILAKSALKLYNKDV